MQRIAFIKYLILLIFLFPVSVFAQSAIRQDADILKLTEEISAQNLENLVRKLVSFETRHSLSTTKDKKKGIGAARNWAQAEM